MEVLIIVLICLGAIILISLTEQTEEKEENSNEREKVIEQNEQTRNEQEKIMEQNKEASNEQKENSFFNISKKVGNYIYFDEINKKWTIPQGLFKKKINKNMIHSYNDITDFELIEDGNTISKGGIGRAVVGNLIMGPLGAIVGGMSGIGTKDKMQVTQYVVINFWDVNTRTPQSILIQCDANQPVDAFIARQKQEEIINVTEEREPEEEHKPIWSIICIIVIIVSVIIILAT